MDRRSSEPPKVILAPGKNQGREAQARVGRCVWMGRGGRGAPTSGRGGDRFRARGRSPPDYFDMSRDTLNELAADQPSIPCESAARHLAA